MKKKSFENTSYDADDSVPISGLFEYLRTCCRNEIDLIEEENEHFEIDNIPPMDLFTQNSIYYIAGYLVKSILTNAKDCCTKKCLNSYVLDEPPQEEYSYLCECRDFTGKSLVYVNNTLFLFFDQMSNIFLNNFEKFVATNNNLSITS